MRIWKDALVLVSLLLTILPRPVQARQSELDEPLLLVLDAPKGWSDELNTFRTMKDPFQETASRVPVRTGMGELRISGSSQFGEKGLADLLKRIPASKVTIFDLRQESHGLVNGLPVSWEKNHDRANVGKDREWVIRDEKEKLARLKAAGKVVLTRLDEKWSRNRTEQVLVTVQSVSTEEEAVTRAGARSVRFPVSDHSHPVPEDVDAFVAIARQQPADGWMHFHCKAGLGRTSVFLVMADMMKNAGTVPREDIMRRQPMMVAYDLYTLPAEPDNWRYGLTRDRKAFLETFYEYSTAQRPGFEKPYSQWLKERPPPESPGALK